MSVGYNYELVYATHRDGFSLLNLYGKMAEFPESPVWLLIRDNHRCVRLGTHSQADRDVKLRRLHSWTRMTGRGEKEKERKKQTDRQGDLIAEQR